MKNGPKSRTLLILALIAAAIAALLLVRWYFVLKRAHSSFEDYYAFRGCSELLERGSDYAVCRLNSGQVIKIVKFEGLWYLDGDLPSKTGISW